jgi:hypothetical protein
MLMVTALCWNAEILFNQLYTHDRDNVQDLQVCMALLISETLCSEPNGLMRSKVTVAAWQSYAAHLRLLAPAQVEYERYERAPRTPFALWTPWRSTAALHKACSSVAIR